MITRGQNVQSLPAVLTVAATPHAGKTSLIMALIDQLRDQLNMAVLLGADATAADVEKFEATGIPACAADFSDDSGIGFDADALRRLDLIVREMSADSACHLWLVSVAEVPGVEMPAAEALVVNKIDTAERVAAKRDNLMDAVGRLQPQGEVFLTSATTGAGLESLAQWVLQRFDLAE